MRSLLAPACIYFAALAMTFGASPSIFTFDDLTPGTLPGHDATYEGPIPDGYHGLHWQNFWALDTSLLTNPSGYLNGVVSLNNVAFNGGGNSALFSTGTFDLNSAYLGAAWNDGLHVEVQGFTGSTLVYDNTYTVNTAGSTLINFNYLGVDSVKFISSGGTSHGYLGSGTHFLIDNLVITVPEPSAIAL